MDSIAYPACVRSGRALAARAGIHARARVAVRALAACAGVVITYACAGSAIAVDTAAHDPIEGLWLGTAGPPGGEQAVVGLDFRRDKDGALALFITHPLLNVYSQPLPGKIERSGPRVTMAEVAMQLDLVDDRLEGTLLGPNAKATLTRATSLPQPPKPPDVPTGAGPRWETRLSGQVFAPPVIADGVVYVGATGGVFEALRVRDGTRVWSFAAGRPIYGAATVAGDAVYFVCDNGYLFKLARETGKELWRYDLGDARVSRILGHPAVFDWDHHAPAPLVADGVVYVGSGDGGVHAIDAVSGAARWRVSVKGRARAGVALDGARIVVASTSGFIHSLDRASGRELWSRDTGAPIDTTPLVDNGAIYVGNRGVGVIALDAATGERHWRTTFWGSWVESTPAIVDGVLYVGSSDLRRVSALDPRDGRVLWRTDVFGWTWGTPLVTPTRIYAGAAAGKPYSTEHVASLVTLDRATGRIVERYPLPEVRGAFQWGIGGSLVRDGDMLVATTIEGGVFGFPLGGS